MDLDTTSAPVIGKERLLRDRNSQLSLPAKSFKDVLELLRVAQVEQAKWKSAAAAKPHHPRVCHPSAKLQQSSQRAELGRIQLLQIQTTSRFSHLFELNRPSTTDLNLLSHHSRGDLLKE